MLYLVKHGLEYELLLFLNLGLVSLLDWVLSVLSSYP